MFAESFAKGFRKELKEAREKGIKKGIKEGIEKGIIEGEKKSFFNGIVAMIMLKFGDIANNLREQIMQLNFKSFNLLDYTNLISNSKSAEEAYKKIAKLASAQQIKNIYKKT